MSEYFNIRILDSHLTIFELLDLTHTWLFQSLYSRFKIYIFAFFSFLTRLALDHLKLAVTHTRILWYSLIPYYIQSTSSFYACLLSFQSLKVYSEQRCSITTSYVTYVLKISNYRPKLVTICLDKWRIKGPIAVWNMQYWNPNPYRNRYWNPYSLKSVTENWYWYY